MNDIRSEPDVTTSALQEPRLRGLVDNLTATSGTLFGGLDELCLLAEKFGNDISSDLINAENRLVLNGLQIG
jgi:hypothetical protein